MMNDVFSERDVWAPSSNVRIGGKNEYFPRNIRTMRKKDLEIALGRLKTFSDPDPRLEQYPTPAAVAADILFRAYSDGDVADMKVIDLGCGTGIFAIGAALLGAGKVIGFDVSEEAVKTAEANAAAAGAEAEFVISDVSDISEGADTVFMNPPFGCQTRKADRPFLDKAMGCAECVYSLHKAETFPFVESYCERRGKKASVCKVYKYDIPHTFVFHREAKRSIEMVAVKIR